MRKHDDRRLREPKLSCSKHAAVTGDENAVLPNENGVHKPKLDDRARDLRDLGFRVGSGVSGMRDQAVERPLLDLGGKVRLHGVFGF